MDESTTCYEMCVHVCVFVYSLSTYVYVLVSVCLHVVVCPVAWVLSGQFLVFAISSCSP